MESATLPLCDTIAMTIQPQTKMKALTYWNPLQDLMQIKDCAARALSAGSNGDRTNGLVSEQPISRWVPILDLTEDDGSYLIQFEIPGIDKDDVSVTVEDGMLCVRGERRIENVDRRVHRMERCYGSFSRSLVIPDDADADKIEAHFRNGLLQVKVPKHEASKPRKIEVAVK